MSLNQVPVPARQARVLGVLGIIPWVRRARSALAPSALVAGMDGVVVRECIVLLPGNIDTRARMLLERALLAVDWVPARMHCVTLMGDTLPDGCRSACIWLACGEMQAQALGRVLPAEVLQQACIVLADEPVQWRHGAGKRRLWTALRQLRRQLTAD